jgi:hypothetical protein
LDNVLEIAYFCDDVPPPSFRHAGGSCSSPPCWKRLTREDVQQEFNEHTRGLQER